MEILEPFNVIYQTAEDGLGDTIKPRLIEAGADLERVLRVYGEEPFARQIARGIEKKRADSEQRLMDRAYAQQLADLGYNVPNKYL